MRLNYITWVKNIALRSNVSSVLLPALLYIQMRVLRCLLWLADPVQFSEHCKYKSHILVSYLCEPVWPSGKALVW